MPVIATHLLHQAARGEMHVVESISGEDDIVCRLNEVGLGEGVNVVVEKHGNPSILRAGNAKLAVARELLDRVLVRCTHETGHCNGQGK